MSRYLMISSRDPFSCGSTASFYDLAKDMRRSGHEVTLFLVENGVFAARRGARCAELASALAAGVTVLADEFALRQRALAPEALQQGVACAPLERVIDELEAQAKALWH